MLVACSDEAFQDAEMLNEEAGFQNQTNSFNPNNPGILNPDGTKYSGSNYASPWDLWYKEIDLQPSYIIQNGSAENITPYTIRVRAFAGLAYFYGNNDGIFNDLYAPTPTSFNLGGGVLNEEILNAIKELKQLEEIIFFFDNHAAGREAVQKYGAMLKTEYPKLKLTTAEPISKDINETLQLHNEGIFIELLNNRTELIFSYSVEDKTTEPNEKTTAGGGSPLDFLKRKHLLKNINTGIRKAGIVGEDNSRMLLFLITLSYLNKHPLHSLIQESSGSGKTHLINRIADLMPQEDVLRFTRMTESSLYNWGEFDLYQKVIVIEDLDGLKEDALYALREFISNQVLRSSITIKDKKGHNKSSHKIVKGQFSSLSATTKGEIYEDNMSRSFVIALDESKEQTQRIIQYQNKRNAGEIDPNQSQKTIGFIQKVIRELKVYEVINPYATKLQLPETNCLKTEVSNFPFISLV